MGLTNFRFKNTLYLSLLGVFLISINIFFDLDIFERIVDYVHQHEEYDIDELFLLFVPLLAGLLIDLNNEKHRKAHAIDRERLLAFKATMNTVHDINNNFLNAIQFFISEAKDNDKLDKQMIEEINSAIFKTANQLKQLGDINHTDETEYAEGIKGIDYKTKE